MPRITDIEAQKRRDGRVSVSLDDEFWTGMPAALAGELNLKIGQEITLHRKKEIESQVSEEAAMGSAGNLLSYRDRSVSEMSKRLAEKGFGEDIIKETIDRLLGYGYLDDERFARDLAIVQIERGKGKRAAQSALYKAGLDNELINQALQEVYGGEGIELEAAIDFLQRKKLPETPADRQRLLRNLAGRGFSFDIAKEAISQWESAED